VSADLSPGRLLAGLGDCLNAVGQILWRPVGKDNVHFKAAYTRSLTRSATSAAAGALHDVVARSEIENESRRCVQNPLRWFDSGSD